MLYKITSFYESQIYGNLLNYFIIQLWHVLHNNYWITYFGYDWIRHRRINICDKVWIYMAIKENGYQEPSLPGSCGYIFVLAFCILMIFCLHIWKATPLNYPRATSGEIPTTPLPLGVNLGIGLYYR